MTCGTALSADGAGNMPQSAKSDYEYQYGETDLMERAVHPVGRRYMLGAFVFLVAMMILGIGIIFAPSLLQNAQQTITSIIGEKSPTPSVTFIRPTVTQGSPTRTPTATISPSDTPTITPTPEPCRQTVQTGDLLWDVVVRCGHFSDAVLAQVIEMNDLKDAGTIFAGQILEIPWPTPTLDPSIPTIDPEASGDTEETQNISFDPLFFPTPTLQAGIQFHNVTAGENIITIALQYKATVEILSQLNPEVTFSQCDYSLDLGGERCTVMVFEGQLIRVPAPTPTPTLSPTPSGSETPTPTPTATFNAPVAQSPSNRAFFRRNDLVTLRWSPTGTLGTDENYRVSVRNLSTRIEYTAYTLETAFVIPTEWQARSETLVRHEYEWTISVVNINDGNRATYTTPAQIFVWETGALNSING
ncbi:MAG TPA: LysM peptidoglycan-binding domain-containing protein [Aggregatilineales bacterium]|nr:LysM peptidoglycan-binding domain-containing protein [Aggregatilineales bacterium]